MIFDKLIDIFYYYVNIMLIIDIFKLSYEHTIFFIGENFFLGEILIFTKIIFMIFINNLIFCDIFV